MDKSNEFIHFWRILAPESLPVPEAEYPFSRPLGRRHRFDWAWPAVRVAVEVDGGQWAPRGGRHARDADRDKLNIAASLGWRVFRFSPDQLRREPQKCVEMVASVISKLYKS